MRCLAVASFVLLSAMPGLAAAGAGAAESEARTEAFGSRPNILFIFVDDLGYGDVGAFFQNERAAQNDRSKPTHKTPALDRLAAEGMQLRHHYCPAPVCAPSRASLLLGVHQGHANVRDNQFDKELEDNHTLATVLKTAGYATVAIGKYGLQGGQEREEIEPPHWPAHPNRRGFDYYYGYIRHRDGHEHYPKDGIHRGSKEVWENMQEVSGGLDKCYTTDLFTAKAKQVIIDHVQDDESADKPFFMYLAYDTPHAVLSLPTQAYPEGGGLKGGLQWTGESGRMINTASGEPDSYYHPDYADATWDHDNDSETPEVAWPDVQKRYATIVRRIDDAVADLLQLLKDLDIDDNTLIVFTNDNGPSVESYLAEKYEPTFFQAYGPYDGIKRDLWEAGVHVGGLVRWPAHVPEGSSSDDHATAFWDWMPTFCEAAGTVPPARSDGVSLLPLLSGNADAQPPSTIYIEYFQNGRTPQFADFDPSNRGRQRNQMQLIREGRFVGVRYDIRSHNDDFEIYDIVEDTRQSNDLAKSKPDLQQRMKDRVLRLRRPDASAKRPYDSETIPAAGDAATEPGVRWAAAAGEFPWAPQSSGLQFAKQGTADSPGDVELLDEPAAYLIEGFLEVPADGEYTLTLKTSDRALVRLHEATVLDADGTFGKEEQNFSATIRLSAGRHPIRIHRLRSETNSDATFELHWSGGGVPAGPVPAAAFRRESKGA